MLSSPYEERRKIAGDEKSRILQLIRVSLQIGLGASQLCQWNFWHMCENVVIGNDCRDVWPSIWLGCRRSRKVFITCLCGWWSSWFEMRGTTVFQNWFWITRSLQQLAFVKWMENFGWRRRCLIEKDGHHQKLDQRLKVGSLDPDFIMRFRKIERRLMRLSHLIHFGMSTTWGKQS